LDISVPSTLKICAKEKLPKSNADCLFSVVDNLHCFQAQLMMFSDVGLSEQGKFAGSYKPPASFCSTTPQSRKNLISKPRYLKELEILPSASAFAAQGQNSPHQSRHTTKRIIGRLVISEKLSVFLIRCSESVLLLKASSRFFIVSRNSFDPALAKPI